MGTIAVIQRSIFATLTGATLAINRGLDHWRFKMLQLRDSRGRFMRPIKSWGVELEGGFDGSYRSAAKILNWHVGYDESISTFAEDAELISPVYYDLSKLKHDLRVLMGYLEDANGSMGFHVHIGVPDKVYYLLSSWGYVRFFQDEVVAMFPEVQQRLENNFCKRWDRVEAGRTSPWGGGAAWPRNHTLQVQAMDKYDENGNDRYTSINFCRGLHGTIEYRLFPATDWDKKAFDYLDFVEWSVAEWVSNNSLGLIAERAEIAPDDAGEALIDLDAEPLEAPPEPDFAEAGGRAWIDDYFNRVLNELFPQPASPTRTLAELEGRLVYPHAPGCAACDDMRQNGEERILSIHQPRVGSRLRISTHASPGWTDADDDDYEDEDY